MASLYTFECLAMKDYAELVERQAGELKVACFMNVKQETRQMRKEMLKEMSKMVARALETIDNIEQDEKFETFFRKLADMSTELAYAVKEIQSGKRNNLKGNRDNGVKRVRALLCKDNSEELALLEELEKS